MPIIANIVINMLHFCRLSYIIFDVKAHLKKKYKKGRVFL